VIYRIFDKQCGDEMVATSLAGQQSFYEAVFSELKKTREDAAKTLVEEGQPLESERYRFSIGPEPGAPETVRDYLRRSREHHV
jgi:hypothetical protein